jgi:hypothetical protein
MRSIKIALCFLLLALVGHSGEAWADEAKKMEVKIEIDYLGPGEKIPIGDLPIDLTNELLQKLFPELKNPRQVLPKDIEIHDLSSIFTQGLTFVLKGDFNNDGVADVVFSGRYLADNKEEKGFVAVISFLPGPFVEREFLQVFRGDRDVTLALDRYHHYKPGIDGILIYGHLASEDTSILYWTGSHYKLGMAPGTEEYYAPMYPDNKPGNH